MPWEKEFDVDEAVDRAMKVFWAKGYEATSISDLTTAMGINKGSLYNAFGNKMSLFTRALLKYDTENRRASLKQLDAMDDPIEAVRTLFDSLVAESVADVERKGCLLVNTALDLPNHTEDIREMVTSALQEFEQFFVRVVERAQVRGQAPAHLDPNEVAKSLLTQVVGLRVLARGAFDAESLGAIGSQALEKIAA